MKTPENFNHSPNVGLTAMAADNGWMDKSVLEYTKDFATPESEAKNHNNKADINKMTPQGNDVGGVSDFAKG